MGGTYFMTDAQVGKYIRALCAQKLSGHLTKDQLYSIIKDDPVVLLKFVKDEKNMFFNERLELEINKRLHYSELQRDRANARWKKNDAAVLPRHQSGNAYVDTEVVIDTDTNTDTTKTTKPPNNIAFEINGTKIPYSFYMSVLKKCNGDIEQAGRVFFRAKCRATQNPIAWISKGMMKDDKGEYYAMKSIREEDEDPQGVREWIDTVVNHYKDDKNG
jgi:hypothetical protein